MTTSPESPRLRRAELPAQVDALVCDLLAKTPDERPSDAGIVRARIAAAQADLALAGAQAVLLRAASPHAEATSPVRDTVSIEEPQLGSTAGSQPPTPKRRRRTIVALAAAAIAAAIAVAVAAIVVPMLHTEASRVAESRIRPSTPAATSPAAAAVPPPITAQSLGTSPSIGARAAHTASPTHTETPTPPAPRIDPITAMRQTISQQVAEGSLKADVAASLNHMVDDLAKTIATGNTADVMNKIKALRAKLTTLNKGRQLSDAGYRALNNALDQIAADQPVPSSTPPPPPPSPHH